MKDWIIVGLSFIGSIIWSCIWSLILYSLRPKLVVQKVEITGDNHIKIDVKNRSKCYDAVNINVEACIVTSSNQTYHLDIDRADFIILPKKDNRVFQSYNLAQSAKEYYKGDFSSFVKTKIKDKNTIFRVRVYANHSFSGFGKAFENKFQYKMSNELKNIK
jgi:hypothetical protein